MAKKKNVPKPIRSMGDLVDLVNHNCEVFDRRTKKLAKSTRNLKVLCVVTIGYAVYTAVKSRNQEEQIYQLSVKVKKLERGEGE